MRISEGPMEKYMLHGPDCFSDVELITVVAGCDQLRAVEIITQYPGICAIADASVGELVAAGLSKGQALRLHAGLALGRRAAIRFPMGSLPITSVHAAVGWFQSALCGLDHEEMHALYLDRRLRPIQYKKISSGSDGATVVEPRQILKVAVGLGASAICVAHNHPSGDPEPSPEDRMLTRRLAQGCETLGIRLIDHIVVAGERWVSFAERGEIR